MEKILIIDDERFTQQILNKSLVEHYDTRTADNGLAGIKIAEEWEPNVILLDVEMPGQNGYEVCDELKHRESTRDIPVVFLSSHDSLREKMLGFEVGADDYLVKSCSKELLVAKIDRLSEIYSQRNQFKNTASDAEKTAIEAMATSFELGKAVRFVEMSHLVTDFDQLGKNISELARDLKLNACIMMNANNEQLFYTTSASGVSPIESDLMRTLHEHQRIVDFGCRTQINYPRIAILVKNMPLDDRARYGRIKDTLPFILSASDAKIGVLETQRALSNQNKILANSVANIKGVLSSLSETIGNHHKSVSDIMYGLSEGLNLYIHKIALEEDQESYILGEVSDAAQKLVSVSGDNDAVIETLAKTASLIEHIHAEHDRIISESLASGSTIDEDISQDIELF